MYSSDVSDHDSDDTEVVDRSNSGLPSVTGDTSQSSRSVGPSGSSGGQLLPPDSPGLHSSVAGSILAPIFDHLVPRGRGRGRGQGSASALGRQGHTVRPAVSWQAGPVILRDSEREEAVRRRMGGDEDNSDVGLDSGDEVPDVPGEEGAEATELMGEEGAGGGGQMDQVATARRSNFHRSKCFFSCFLYFS